MKPDYERVYYYDEVLQAMNGNVPQKELDEQLSLFKQYARYLGTKPNKLVLYAVQSQEDPKQASFKDGLTVTTETKFNKKSTGDSVGMSIDGIKFVRQEYEMSVWLEFKSREDLEKYFQLIEDFE